MLAAVKVILLVDTEAPRVTVWRRGEAGWHNHEEKGLDATICRRSKRHCLSRNFTWTCPSSRPTSLRPWTSSPYDNHRFLRL
ncbi:hypothetical protein [Kumtagia ephedrae]|uniref:hypothetical protein n=1 Tax=Kumtagia ephedrae TaxID=2116701 RepID=UPI002477FFD5|nr:hypothetical protein [Mesorhizobium ephedrae]